MCIKVKWVKYVCLIAIAALTGCLENEESEFEKALKADENQINTYLDSNNLEATKTESGIYYSVLKENDQGRKVALTNVVTVKYKMSTLAGKFIDSASVTSEGKPIRFGHVNDGIVPSGINRGVSMMREGEMYRFYIPSLYGFYDYSYRDLIPANAILVADVEIVKVQTAADIKAEEKQIIQNYIAEHQLTNVVELDSGVYYQTIEAKSGEELKNGNVLTVAYKGLLLNDSIFAQSKADTPLKFTLGYDDRNYIPGFVQGLKKMKKGEKARVFIPSHMAYEQGIQVLPEEVRKDYLKKIEYRDWRPYVPIIFELELLEVK